MEDKELHDLLIENGIPEYDAGEILVFLPTAFCRKLIPEINWQEEYIDFYSESEQIKRKFLDNERYQLIELETDNYWNSSPKNEVKLALAVRSPEYKSVTQLLRNGSMPDDIEVSEPIVVRLN